MRLAQARALAGSMADYGIDDGLIEKLAETIPANSSALFLLIRKVLPEKVPAEFKGEHARILRTSFSPEQEARLRRALPDHTLTPSPGAATASAIA